MCAPKTPRLARVRSQKCSYNGSASSPGRGHHVTRPVPATRVAVQRELADAEDLAFAERLVHPPVGIREHAQGSDLVGEPIGLGLRVGAGDTQQHEQPGADLADLLAIHGDRRAAHPLD